MRHIRPASWRSAPLRMAPSGASEPVDATDKKLPLLQARQCCATWYVCQGPCRWTLLRTPAGALEPADTATGDCHRCRGKAGFCHVVLWLELSDLHRFRTACRKLPERNFPEPAPENTNNILARWNKKQRSQATRRRAMVLVTLWTREHTRALELFCKAQQSTCYTRPVGLSLGQSRSDDMHIHRIGSTTPKQISYLCSLLRDTLQFWSLVSQIN